MAEDDQSSSHGRADPIVVESERLSGVEGDFLRSVHRRIRHRGPDGLLSPPYQADSVIRPLGLDAVAMVLHHRGDQGGIRVGLRCSLRPAVALDRPADRARPLDGRIWEIPAGILEMDDLGEDGRRRRCRLEAHEEMGLLLPEGSFQPLGAPLWLSPGVIAERVYLYHAPVDEAPPADLPVGDGSPMESGAALDWPSLDEAIRMSRLGHTDAKTEVALCRLRDSL